MEIGGTDIVLMARRGLPVLQLIVHRVRQMWPDGIFQDADESETFRLSCQELSRKKSPCREFFIYCDEANSTSWNLNGATSENQNAMLHFLIGDPSKRSQIGQSVTIVCGEETSEIRELLKDLRASFRFNKLIRQDRRSQDRSAA